MIRHLMLLLATTASLLSDPVVVKLWPEGNIPGELANEPESTVQRNDGFQRITNVSHPTLTLFHPTNQEGKPVPCMIVCPGGGYRYTVVDKEGSEIAKRFNAAGVAGIVLKYRTPNNRNGALQDLQRALSLVRSEADTWNIDPNRIGVIGFSAGGHLSARASTLFEKRSYAAIDSVDKHSCRPDFEVLVYPAYLDDKKGGVSTDLDLSVNIPSTLIIHSNDDKRHVVGSKIYSSALSKIGKHHTIKLYSTGGHGYGLHSQGEARKWPEDAVAWLEKIGMLKF